MASRPPKNPSRRFIYPRSLQDSLLEVPKRYLCESMIFSPRGRPRGPQEANFIVSRKCLNDLGVCSFSAFRRPTRPSRSPQERPRDLQDRPRTAQEARKTAPREPKDDPRGLQDAQEGIQDGQDGPKRAQYGPNMSPRRRKMHPRRPKMASIWPKTAQDASQEASKTL